MYKIDSFLNILKIYSR